MVEGGRSGWQACVAVSMIFQDDGTRSRASLYVTGTELPFAAEVELGGIVDVELENVLDAVVLEAESAATACPHPANPASPTTTPGTS
jgi:hypothetical protein